MTRWMTALLLSLALVACGGDDEPAAPDPSRASLVYHYQDASVPPEYHRSYTLDLAARDGGGADGELVVDSYGDVLHRVDVDVEAAVWERAVAALADLDRSSSDADPGCAGGTGRSIAVDVAGEELVAVDLDVCGDDGGARADELDAVIAPLLADLDMTTLLAPT